MKTLTLPSLTAKTLPSWLEHFSAFSPKDNLTLTLPGKAFLEPGGLAFLAAAIASRSAEGKSTAMRIEDPDSDCVRYLHRIDFFRSLGVRTEETSRRRTAEGRFVPLIRILDLKAAKDLAEAIAGFLEAQIPDAPVSVIRGLRFITEELGANIVQHSGRPETGFGVAQAFPKAKRFQLAFCDCGVGFLKSLQRNPELEGRVESDGEAIQLAVEQRVSGVPGRTNMGFGLSLLRDLADRLSADLWILSGAALWHRYTAVGAKRVSTIRAVPVFPGSWICLDGPVNPA